MTLPSLSCSTVPPSEVVSITLVVSVIFEDTELLSGVALSGVAASLSPQPTSSRVIISTDNTIAKAFFIIISPLYYLEYIELQIIGLFDAPEDGVIGALLTAFDLTQADVSV